MCILQYNYLRRVSLVKCFCLTNLKDVHGQGNEFQYKKYVRLSSSYLKKKEIFRAVINRENLIHSAITDPGNSSNRL